MLPSRRWHSPHWQAMAPPLEEGGLSEALIGLPVHADNLLPGDKSPLNSPISSLNMGKGGLNEALTSAEVHADSQLS